MNSSRCSLLPPAPAAPWLPPDLAALWPQADLPFPANPADLVALTALSPPATQSQTTPTAPDSRQECSRGYSPPTKHMPSRYTAHHPPAHSSPPTSTSLEMSSPLARQALAGPSAPTNPEHPQALSTPEPPPDPVFPAGPAVPVAHLALRIPATPVDPPHPADPAPLL